MSINGFGLLSPVEITDAMLTGITVPENDHPAWNAATAYAVGDRVMRTSVHKIYERRVAGTTSTAPENDPTNWLEISPTNRWKMFDSSVASQTTNPNSIIAVVVPAQPCNAVYVGNVSASQVTVVLTDPLDGVVYSKTVNMVSDSGITDWYAYFFEPIERRTDVLFDDVPPYSSGQIGLTVSDPSATAAVGVFLAGYVRQIGTPIAGASVGIKDYSRKEPDEFGGYAVVQREYSKRARFNVQLANTLVDPLLRLLARYRATPVLYIASVKFEATLIYGFFRDFDIVIAGPVISEASIEVEGLT